MGLNNMMAIILMLSVILMAGCSTSEPVDEQEQNNFVPDTDIETVPGNQDSNAVAAVVNGEEILSRDVVQVQQLLLQQGQQVSEEEVLEQVINQKVLEQRVQQEGITVTTEEAESLMELQLSQQGASLEEYMQQLEAQGISYQSELENIKSQLATQTYLENALADQEFEVTEEEATAFYEMYEQQSQEEVPPYEELQPQIIATLQQQKQQQAINSLIQELRFDADVEYR